MLSHMPTEVANIPEGDLVLLESSEGWILTQRFDPELHVGSVIQFDGQTWRVTWDSDEGFGKAVRN